MQAFCISLGLSKSSQIKLQELPIKIIIKPNLTNYFYHTSFMQGLTNDYEALSEFLLEIKVKFFQNYLNEFIIWDKVTKKINKPILEKFNDKFSALILPYENSNFLNYFSIKLSKILINENYLLNKKFDLSKNKELLNLEKKNLYSNLINYYYKASLGLINPHTTLGFLKYNFENSEQTAYLNKYFNNMDIIHDGIYLSTLNDFCMTSSFNRIKLLSL